MLEIAAGSMWTLYAFDKIRLVTSNLVAYQFLFLFFLFWYTRVMLISLVFKLLALKGKFIRREIKKSREFYEWKELKNKEYLIYSHGDVPKELYVWLLVVFVSHIFHVLLFQPFLNAFALLHHDKNWHCFPCNYRPTPDIRISFFYYSGLTWA